MRLLMQTRVVRYIPGWFPGAAFQRQAREWRVFAAAVGTALVILRRIFSGDEGPAAGVS